MIASGNGNNGYKVSRFLKRHLIKEVEQLYIEGKEDENGLEEIEESKGNRKWIEEDAVEVGDRIEREFRRKQQKIYKYHNNVLNKTVSLKTFNQINRDIKEITKENDEFIDKAY